MYEWGQVTRRCASARSGVIPKSTTLIYRRYSSEFSSIEDHASQVSGIVLESEADDKDLEELAPDTKGSRDHSNGQNEGSRTSQRRPLPVSPLMDEHYLAASQRRRLRKAAPTKNPTLFQQQLARNPYARALATPVRRCILTRTNLPSFFLQDFELITHPTTNEPWYLPRSLTSPYAPTSSTESAKTSPTSPSSAIPFKGSRLGPKVWVLSRSAILRATVSDDKSPFRKGYERFPSSRSLDCKAFRPGVIRWRTDMDMFVLELMRRRVVEGLKYLHVRNKGYLVPCRSWKDVPMRKAVGAVLWSGPEDPEKLTVGADEFSSQEKAPDRDEWVPADEIEPGMKMDEKIEEEQILEAQAQDKQTGEEDVEDDEIAENALEGILDESKVRIGPGEFATLDVDKTMKSKIPVHNLRHLLGETHITELRHAAPEIFNGELAVLKHKRTTIDMQLRLWKLQGYLSRHSYVG